MTEIKENLFTEDEERKLNNIISYINNKSVIKKKYKNKSLIFYIDKEGKIKTKSRNAVFSFNGIGIEYDFSKDYTVFKGEFSKNIYKRGIWSNNKTKEKSLEGTFDKYGRLSGENCIKYYKDGKTIKYKGLFESGEFVKGEYYTENGKLRLKGSLKNNELIKLDQKQYYNITIQKGKYKNYFMYSGTGYLRDNLKDNKTNSKNKIYTLTRDKVNPNIRTLTFFTANNNIGLDRDIQIQIDENNIATLQGEPLTENEINKIKAFFNNIPIEQLMSFDDYLATLYYSTIMNKEEYRDTNILIPDLCKYNYKKGKEVSQTITIINQIPQDKRMGKYIIPCRWLRLRHQINLRIDFDNKICEIVNTGGFIDETVINNLQKELNNQYKGENWVVCENNIITQSTGNCVIASNITATEKTVVEKQVEEYNKKIKQLEEVDKEIKTTKEKYKKQYKEFKKEIKIKKEELNKLKNALNTKEKEYRDSKTEQALQDMEYEELKNKLFNRYKGWNKLKDKYKKDGDEVKLNFLLEKTRKKLKKLEPLNTPEQQKKKQKCKCLQKQIQQALYLLKIQELEKEIKLKEETKIKSGKRADINSLKQKKEKIQKEQHTILQALTNSKGELKVNDTSYNTIKVGYKTQMETIIPTNTEKYEQKRGDFIRCNLLLQQILLKQHTKQFDLELTQKVIQKAYAIRV